VLLMRRYVFHAFERGILFRGSFAIGTYLEDAETNTVMGDAVADAAAWYDRAAWLGVASTPRTNTALECYAPKVLNDVEFIHMYPVPLTDGSTIDLYVVSWPGMFHEEETLKKKKTDSWSWFIKLLNNFPVPAGTEAKFANIKQYFAFVGREMVAEKSKSKK
jgi:hypothetical protein